MKQQLRRILALIPLFLLLIDCTRGGNPQNGKGGGEGKGGKAIPVAVRVAKVESKVTPRIIYAVAALSGRQQADVYTKVVGRITSIGPKDGQPVKAGETLFRVDRSDPGESYLNAPIVSPISGWVGRWRVTNVGEQVTPGDPVVTIVDDEALKSLVYLPSSDWLEVHSDTKVTAILNDEERPGKIAFISRAADISSGRGSVTVEVPNAKRDWRAGMFPRFRFELSPKERILINASSLIITDAGAYVYVVDGQHANRVLVEFRVMDADTIEILHGLPADASVVVAGANLLGDQSPIQIIN